MVRNNRKTLRFGLILVLLAAWAGWQYANSFWQVDPNALFALPASEGEGDWVEFAASLAERLLQAFQSLASPG